jgi:hypothetical protein
MKKYFETMPVGVRMFCDKCDIELTQGVLDVKRGYVHKCTSCNFELVTDLSYPMVQFKVSYVEIKDYKEGV